MAGEVLDQVGLGEAVQVLRLREARRRLGGVRPKLSRIQDFALSLVLSARSHSVACTTAGKRRHPNAHSHAHANALACELAYALTRYS
eukprot:2004972-Pleurochrysis_carterae.AAC.2